MISLLRPVRPSICQKIINTSSVKQRWLHSSLQNKLWSRSPSTGSIGEDDVAKLASRPLRALTLADLVRHGRPPLSTEALFRSANFTLSLLPVRIAHRIQALRNLPFIVVSNPNVSSIYNNDLSSLSTLLPFIEKPIVSLEDEVRLTEVLADLVQTHMHTIPTLARGFLECRKYISSEEVMAFLDEHFRARISSKVIAEQHIALHCSSQPFKDTAEGYAPGSFIGVIDTELQPANIINSCGNFVSEICELKYGVRPTWVIDGEPSTKFAYLPSHLEYIITELLKNAFRATIESGRSSEPVVITIAAEPHSESSATPGTTKSLEESVPGMTIRIRDRGGGISPATLPNIFTYSFTTFNEEDNDLPGAGGGMEALNAISAADNGSSIAGLGYGLPLGRAYAEFFGGGIEVQSLWGWGTDVYLKLKGVGKIS